MTGAIRLYSSNRLELLVDQLASAVKHPLGDPLEQEVIVVQSRGMERWLAMQLSERLGAWANCRYPFPNALAWEVFRLAFPSLPEENPYSPESIIWRLMEIIPQSLGSPVFAPLQSYLADDGRGVKLFQLAGAVADLFDQYTLFRPEMLSAWEHGRSCDICCWQAELWRNLSQDEKRGHRGMLLKEFQRLVSRKDQFPGKLPGRISVFGIPSLPPFHLQILSALATRIEVNLFLLNPSQEYWCQIVSPIEKSRKISLQPELPGLFDLLEIGNPLLASMGGQGRDFFELLYNECSLDEGAGGLFGEPGKGDMLHEIQRDILDLKDGTTSGVQVEIGAGDNSLRILSCHSPLREVEALHDRLLELFEIVPGLSPRDILVMIPQIDEYAPFISSVFGSTKDPELRIPYSIADRTLASNGSLARAFLELLDIAESRFEASRIMDLLEKPFVAGRFGLDDAGVVSARRWITESGIRWGVDAADRENEGLPPFGENSWGHGLDRLLLGYAMPGDDSSLFEGILPYPEIEGGDARNLGGVMAFANSLFALRRSRSLERTPSEWSIYLSGLLESFFLPDDEVQEEHAFLSYTFDELRKKPEESGFTGTVSLQVVRSWLFERTSKAAAAEGFLTGRVTFCAMLPMRSIPFRVIALLGMNDGLFPRQQRPAGFDLMATSPKRCDRSIRNEDRYLFLESLLSARDALHISYVGQSSKDNSAMPPSVLVSELLDYAERAFTVPGADENQRRTCVRDRIVVKHHLQPFHKDYFNRSSALFSYSTENCTAADARQTGGGGSALLEGIPLPPPDTYQRHLTIDQLGAFLRNPAGSFLRRLGLRIEGLQAPMEDSEPFVTDGLDRYNLGNELVEAFLSGEDPASKADSFLARGTLPPAGPGRAAFAELKGKAERFAAAVAPFVALPTQEPLEVDEVISGYRLTGRLLCINSEGLLRYRCATLKARDLLSCWVQHLVLNLAAPDGYPRESLLLAIDGRWRFARCDNAREHLETLINLYLDGLCEPLPFFPETSHAFAVNPEKPEKLNSVWNGFRSGKVEHPGERQREDAFDLFFGSIPPDELFASARFREVSQAVFAPLLSCLQKE